MPDRIRGYGKNRGVRTGPRHRVLRTCEGVEPIRKHFKPGVNFIEPLVNRHRVELYILDEEGRLAEVFERIHWDEQQVVGLQSNRLERYRFLLRMASSRVASRSPATLISQQQFEAFFH